MKVGDVLVEFKLKPPSGAEAPVLTLTERNGFVLQSERFNKRLATDDTSGYKYINRDDFAFNPYLLWAGAIARNDRFEQGVISPLYPTFRAREGYSPSFLSRIMLSSSMIKGYDSIAFGSVPRRRRSSVKDFLDLEIPELPSFEDQQRIADILDKADALRAKRREAIAHLDSLGQSIFHEMFREDPISRPLSDAVSSLVGGRNIVGSENSSNPIRVLKISAVTSGTYRESESKPLPDRYEPDDSHIVRAGDVLISRANTTELVGASALVQETSGLVALPDKLWRAKPAPEVLPSFLLATLQSDRVRSEISRRSTGSGGSMKNISKPKLLAVPVAIPSLVRQKDFDSRIHAIQQLGSCYRRQLAELDNLFLSLQDRAFKGEL